MRVAITGHRPSKLGNDYTGTSPLMIKLTTQLLELMLGIKPTQLITGMALGVDQLWARLAIQNNIPFIAAVPCWGQYDPWTLQQKHRYADLISHPLCHMHIVTPGPYTHKCMQIRNEWMVDRCDKLIAVWDGTPGGTANCYNYAITKLHKDHIIRINPKEL